ncbi:hypothetical protein [Pseudomonas sp. IT-P218]|uniref:hypothetical protein n=1 Tax=Pseudomonas sp. IT-P218 TaxID=3026449 RepID=UPI0039E12119
MDAKLQWSARLKIFDTGYFPDPYQSQLLLGCIPLVQLCKWAVRRRFASDWCFDQGDQIR